MFRYKNEIKERAIYLRKNCRKSLDEISKELSINRVTIFSWVRNYPLTKEEQYKRREKSIKHNLEKYRKSLKNKKKEIKKRALIEFKKNKKDPMFMLGLGIYIGEGGKGTEIKLNNLDKNVLKIFRSWMKKYFDKTFIFKGRLHLVSWQNEQKCKKYWKSIIPEINIWRKSYVNKDKNIKPLKQNNGLLTLCIVNKKNKTIHYRSEIIKTWINCAYNVR